MSAKGSQQEVDAPADVASENHSRAGSDIEEEKEDIAPAYIPKNPMIRPSDVKISKELQELIGNDKVQEQLHRVLASAADMDNEKTVADHVQKVMNVLIESYPDCALAKFEEVSYLIRNGCDLEKYLVIGGLHRSSKAAAANMKDFVEKTTPLFKKPVAEEDGDEPPEVPAVCSIQDLLADARMFSSAGVSFGQQESYLLQKALQRLAREQSCSYLRFFGKIRCTKADYYVVEATAEGGEEAGEDENADGGEAEDKDPNMEEKGTGVNKYTYFVTNSCFDAWKKLPDLSPTHIQAARLIKVLFSGDLERDIICNPFFFGKEKHLLRAQIARISQSVVLAPKGQYKLNEESERDIEEFVPEEDSKVDPLPSTKDASKLSAWVHVNASILNNCRTLHLDPPEEAPEGFEGEYDIEVAKKEIENADPFEPRLKPISGDEKIKMGGKMMQTPWVVRLVGDQSEYKTEQGKTVCHGVVVVRSLVWPGAFTLYQNGKQTNVYVGDGTKFTDKLKPYPMSPPILNQDPVEYQEFVLPVVKEMTAEDLAQLKAKIDSQVAALWESVDKEEGQEGINAEGAKKLAAQIKAKIDEKDEAEIADEVFDEAFEAAEKDNDGNLSQDATKTLINSIWSKL